jgi:hypothetical protein
MRRVLFSLVLVVAGVVVVQSCGWDSSLREYLSRRFWLPFAKSSVPLERKSVRRVSVPFAGMDSLNNPNLSIKNLRRAYQAISGIDAGMGPVRGSIVAARSALQEALADSSLTASQKEEVALIEAKIEMRFGKTEGDDPVTLSRARQKLQSFLRSARNPAFASEARGWLAHIYWLLGDQAAAGKLYLDELNRDGSNLSRETLLSSLRVVYGYDGRSQLRLQIREYFDTPEHAAFAIQLITNPRTNRTDDEIKSDNEAYRTIVRLAEQHRSLFDSAAKSEELTLLLMRTALRMGDPENVIKTVELIAPNSELLENIDLNWMKASAHFVMHEYRLAEQPLLNMFRSSRSSPDDKAAAAYGLVGVYQKIEDPVEALRYALWLIGQLTQPANPWNSPDGTSVEERTVYWAPSGWDFATLVEYQLSDEALVEFLRRYPDLPNTRLVRYAQAVRLARADRYSESAEVYGSIGSVRRAARMRELADVFDKTNDGALTEEQRMEAQFRFAEYLSNNSERVYFNDSLWHHFQNHALFAQFDSRLTKAERDTFMSAERNLRDLQEERWRAYLILNGIVEKSGKTPLGRKAARLALRCLRGINTGRFGRDAMIREADIRLSNWLR